MDRFATERSVLIPSPALFFRPLEVMLQLQASAFSAVTRLVQCRNLNDAVAIQQQWFDDYATPSP